MNGKMGSTTLKTLSREKAFYFFTSIGNYTGESASSLKDFRDKINKVDVNSLEFHFHRGDFEKWIAGVLEDKSLADRIRKLRRKKYSGDTLRKHLYRIVARRYDQLSNTIK